MNVEINKETNFRGIYLPLLPEERPRNEAPKTIRLEQIGETSEGFERQKVLLC